MKQVWQVKIQKFQVLQEVSLQKPKLIRQLLIELQFYDSFQQFGYAKYLDFIFKRKMNERLK